MTIQKMITVTIKKNKTNENSDITPNNDNILQEKLFQNIPVRKNCKVPKKTYSI